MIEGTTADGRYDPQEAGKSALTLITGVLRALQLYDVGNQIVQRLVGRLCGIATEYQAQMGNTLVLQNDGENFFVNQELLRLDYQEFERLTNLRRTLEQLALNEIEFFGDASVESMSEFFQRMSAAVGDEGLRDELENPVETRVSLRKIEGITKKGRSDESRQTTALRLFNTLHLLSREFVRCGEQGSTPPTVSIRRVVQGLVDLLEGYGDYVLALAHQGGAEQGLAGHLTRSSLFAAALARAAGIPPRLVGRTALVVFMSRLPLTRLGDAWSAAENAEVARVYDEAMQAVTGARRAGAGSAWRLVLLHEAMMDAAGAQDPYGGQLATSFEGRIAAVATHYDRIRAGIGSRDGRPAVPAIAIRRLAAESQQQNIGGGRAPLDGELVRVWVGLLGRVPPGSLVRLKDGGFGVVRDRPTVVKVAKRDGKLRKTPEAIDARQVVPLDAPAGFDPSPALGLET